MAQRDSTAAGGSIGTASGAAAPEAGTARAGRTGSWASGRRIAAASRTGLDASRFAPGASGAGFAAASDFTPSETSDADQDLPSSVETWIVARPGRGSSTVMAPPEPTDTITFWPAGIARADM